MFHYEAASTGYVGSFSTAGLSTGDVFSFDILSIFNNAITGGDSSLGIRLQTEDTVNGGGAWSFNDFRLTTTDDSTGVPSPAPLGLLLLGFVALTLSRKSVK